MILLVAMIPALCWGLNPLFIRKISGRPENEMFGMGVGVALVVVAFLMLFKQSHLPSILIFLAAAVSGAAWALGQLGQYMSYHLIGVSKTMPVSTALQLVGTSLIGVLMFGEWSGSVQKLFGLMAIVLIVIGSGLSVGSGDNGKHTFKDYVPLLVTTCGYWIYGCIPKAIHVNALQLFLPQMLGIMIVSLGWSLAKNHKVVVQKASWLNVIPGVLYGIAAFAYIFAARGIGVTNAYIIGQLSVVISTMGGLVFLHESRNTANLYKVLAGLAFIFVGCVTTALI